MLLCALIAVLCLILSWLLLVNVFRIDVLFSVVLFAVVVFRCLFELLCFVCYGICLWFGLFFYFGKETCSFVVFVFDGSFSDLCFVVAFCVFMSFVCCFVFLLVVS